MARELRRILSVAVLLPVVLFSVAGTSFASWRCRSDGIERLSCCCPKQKADEQQAPNDAGSGPAVSSLGCCEVQQHLIDKTPSNVARGNPTALVAAAVALPVAVLPTPPAVAPSMSPGEPEPEPPPTGRTLLLLKQAFLI